MNCHNIFFQKIVYVAALIVFAFAGAYFYFGAWASAWTLISSAIILTPLILYCEQSPKYSSLGRLLFIATGVFYIYATPLGIRSDLAVEYYFFPTMFATLIFFEPNQKKEIFLGLLLPLIGWIFIHNGFFPEVPLRFQPVDFPTAYFRPMNFFLACFFTGVLVKQYYDLTVKVRLSAIKDLTELNHHLLAAEKESKQSQADLCVLLDKLREKESFLSSILGAIPSLVSYVDTDDRYRYISSQYKTWFGIEPDAFIGKTTTEVIGEAGVTTCRPYFDRAVNGELVEFEEKVSFKTGGTRSVHMIYIPDKNKDGKVQGVYFIATDVSEARNSQLEADNERLKSLQNAKLAALGVMSAGIAHEINNPLFVITGSLGLLSKQLNDPNQIMARITSMQKASERISKIINGLRKFSRSSESGPRQAISISSIITEVSALTEAKANKFFTPLTIDCKTDSKIICDEVEIGQVIINLINNAVDAVKELEEKWVQIVAFDEEDKVILQIRDSGTGISPQIAEKIFQPFFTTKPPGEGTGLGLSIIKGIMKEHCATIEILPTDPNTCFEIKFKKATESHNQSGI